MGLMSPSARRIYWNEKVSRSCLSGIRRAPKAKL